MIGIVKDGVIVLPTGVTLPEGSHVRVEPIAKTLAERFASVIGKAVDLPAKLADSDVRQWKKFGLFSCGERNREPYLNYEVLWTPGLKARLRSHAWLNNTDWTTFIEMSEIGDVFDGLGVLRIVRLRELPEDFDD